MPVLDPVGLVLHLDFFGAQGEEEESAHHVEDELKGNKNRTGFSQNRPLLGCDRNTFF